MKKVADRQILMAAQIASQDRCDPHLGLQMLSQVRCCPKTNPQSGAKRPETSLEPKITVENAVVFGTVAPSVTSVTVSPATATVSAGQSLKLSATVVTAGFANKAVYWSVDATSEAADITIDQNGVLHIPTGTTAASSVTVTATSIYDNTVTGTATITTAQSYLLIK